MAPARSATDAGDRVAALLERRLAAGAAFFGAEAARIADACLVLARSFRAGGRLLAVGGSPQAWSDAHHVAVEFVHPVIVGKRALPALAIAPEQLRGLARPEDAVISFEPLELVGERFDPPTDDPFVRQELCETLYHVVWELVHVFLDHLAGSTAGAGASSFLYPFLEREHGTLEAVAEDVRCSVLMKSEEVNALRRQTLHENAPVLRHAATAIATAFSAGGAVLAFGNGGSATDAADLVADLQPRRAIDLSGDGAIVTALANDIGPDVVFQRQVIAYGTAGDVAVALSTSGTSRSVIAALEEARRRGLVTIALVGYDGGRVAAERLADHVILTRSAHIPRIQEAQASAYHVLCELISTRS